MKPTYEELERQLEESRREFRAADATIHNLELKLTDIAVQLANAESKCRELAAENAGLKAFGGKLGDMHNDLNGEGTGIQGRAEVAIQQVALEAAIEEFDAINTPATDSFLAEVRAQGVEAFVMDFTEPAVMNNGTFYNEDLVEASNWFTALLRKGASE